MPADEIRVNMMPFLIRGLPWRGFHETVAFSYSDDVSR
jgi:hypothetical protein